ncbi:MAG: hypothetical protein IKA63_00015 [Clostridia bacterium]|nr:hypothetical protein [Clostridia bacterium]
MNAFTIQVRDGKIGHIFDNRYPNGYDVTNGKGTFGEACYTRRDEDVTRLPKQKGEPHAQRKTKMQITASCEDAVTMVDAALGVSCAVTSEADALKIVWHYENTVFSKFGGCFPLNLLGQKNGEWQRQFTVSSPYYERDSKRAMCLFTRADGNHLMLIAETPCAAFRVDYSVNMHFIDGFELISNNDRCYGDEPKNSGDVTAYLIPVSSYKEGLEIAAKKLSVPCAYYECSSCQIGGSLPIEIVGECDAVHVIDPNGSETVHAGASTFSLSAGEYGLYRVIPYCGGRAGVECLCFAHYDWKTMFEKSVSSIPAEYDHVIGHTAAGEPVWMPPSACYRGEYDTNLCEHAMWVWAQLRYMQHHPVDQRCRDHLRNFKNIMLADNESAYRERHTLIPYEQDVPHKMAPYNVYKSDRIQEAFNGVNILLDLWRLEKEERYLETAVAAMTSLLEETLRDGCIIRRGYEDYTTVTVMIFPIADLYTALSARGDCRAEQFKRWAEDIADFLVRRGLSFPTESSPSDDYNEFMEDGSMSCTALSVLYVAYFVVNKSEYREFARQVMRLHDAYCIYTCTAPMYHSSVRWWETIWEGDADGQAICCGHAWSIWRGEAEFWLGLLDGDGQRLIDSYNTYLSNFSKQDRDGNMYSIYQCEPYITGTCLTAEEVSRRYAVGFPCKKDNTLSRYVYARAYDTWFSCSAVIKDRLINAVIKDGTLHTEAPFFSRLYIEDLDGDLTVGASREIEVFSKRPLLCKQGEVVKTTPFGFVVKPTADGHFVLANG